ncbi:MAG: C-terminal binding protein [Spirochaetia bacterium]|nr:C-terminal binding protein [Spirochaetia bacterium]
MKKYAMLDSQALAGADFGVEKKILEEAGIECAIGECRTTEEMVRLAADADAIGLCYVDMNGKLMDSLKKCKLLVRYGIGYDSINVPEATARGIAVCNLPDYCQPDVATHAFAMILDCCRKITLQDRLMRGGKYLTTYGYRIHRLSTLKMGFAGFGAIAKTLARYMKPYQMDMLAFDPYLPEEVFAQNGVRQAGFEELLAQADIISVHSPYTPETHHMFCKASFAKMKDGAIIVNTARGPIICLDDLAEALKNGKLAAAGLDTMEGEPNVPPGHPIFACESAILTPHCAFNSAEAELEQHQKVAKSVIEFLGGNIPYNCVNKKQLQK